MQNSDGFTVLPDRPAALGAVVKDGAPCPNKTGTNL